jgi:hypothetical protein
MKTSLVVFFLCICYVSAYTQHITAALQPVIEIPVSQNLIKVENGYLSYKINKRKLKVLAPFSSIKLSKLFFDVTLIKYDESLKLVKENDLSASPVNFAAFEPTIESINGREYLVYYEPQQNEEDGIILKAVEIDITTLSMGQAKDLFKIQIDTKVGVNKLMNIMTDKKLRIMNSPDKSKTMFLFENGIDNSFSSAVVDKDFNLLWTKASLIDIPENIIITSACVDNAGTVYTGYKIEFKKGRITGHILITNQSNREKDIVISEEDYMYQILVLPSGKQNRINVVGTCFGETDYISGVFSASINTNDFKLSGFKRTDFDGQFIDLFDQDGLAYTKKNKFGLYPSRMRIYEMEDGTIGMIGEIKRTKTTSESHQNISGSYNSTSTKTIFSGSILNACFKKDKVVFSRVPKSRETSQTIGVSSVGFLPDTYDNDLRFSSFSAGDGIFALPYKNDVFVFYCDTEDNLKKSLTEMPSVSDKVKNLILVAASISNDGNVKREMLIDLKDEDFLAFPIGIKYITPTSLLIPIRRITNAGKVKDDFRWANINVK